MDSQTTAYITTDMEYDQGYGSGYPDYLNKDLYDWVMGQNWLHEFQWRYHPTLFLVFAVLGTIGGLLAALLSVALYKRLKNNTDIILLTLAMENLPFWIVNVVESLTGWPHRAGLCNAALALYKLNFISGMLLLACISVEHYVAVQASRAHKYSRATWIAMMLLAMLLTVPEMIFAEVKELFNGLAFYCEPLSGNKNMVLVLSLQVCFGFVLPLAVMATCYSIILRTVLQARSFHKHKALFVTLAIVVVFVLFQLPYNVHLVLQVMQLGNSSITDGDVLVQVVRMLAYTHACINPYLYVFASNQCRSYLLQVLRSCVGRLRAVGRGNIAE